MKTREILLLAALLTACTGGREAPESAGMRDVEADPYAEARALFEARQDKLRLAEQGS